LMWHICAGDQLINRIPNCYPLANKLGLLNSLESNEHVMNVMQRSRDLTSFVSDILPETYRVDDLVDRRVFFRRFRGSDAVVSKVAYLTVITARTSTLTITSTLILKLID
jgi:hypothetical protein